MNIFLNNKTTKICLLLFISFNNFCWGIQEDSNVREFNRRFAELDQLFAVMPEPETPKMLEFLNQNFPSIDELLSWSEKKLVDSKYADQLSTARQAYIGVMSYYINSFIAVEDFDNAVE